MLRSRHDNLSDAGQTGGNHHNDVFDRRFVSLFRDELLARGHPRYPEKGWYGALHIASFEFEHLGPMVTLKPQICAGEMRETAGTRRSAYGYSKNDDLVASVGKACDKWLHRRGIAPDRLF